MNAEGVACRTREDLSERLKELERRNRELQSAIAARDTFLAVAAHELRNPMTPILGQVQRLHRLVDSGRCSLADVGPALQRVEALIGLYLKRATTLLDVSRITSGKLRLDISEFAPAELIRAIVAALEPALRHQGASATLKLDDPLLVRSDRLALEQIVDNLLLNAVKYGGGKPIVVRLEASGDNFCLQVRDRGTGISEADRRRIFEPFERAVTGGSVAGFGVGLWVVRQLVDALGGRIEVESAPGLGTTFIVTLPRNATQEQSRGQ